MSTRQLGQGRRARIPRIAFPDIECLLILAAAMNSDVLTLSAAILIPVATSKTATTTTATPACLPAYKNSTVHEHNYHYPGAYQ